MYGLISELFITEGIMSNPEEIDHEHTDQIVCPHCGHEERDSWQHFEGRNTVQIDCEACRKTFTATEYTETTYTTFKE